jgi:hypothetical protein
MKNIYQVLVVVMALIGTPAAAEIIELRCTTNAIDSEGNIQVLPDIGGTPSILVFNTSDRSVWFAAWPLVPATYWDEEIIAWNIFRPVYMDGGTFMFNRSSGLLLVETVSSIDIQNVEAGLHFHSNFTMFYRCTRTF